MSNQKLLSAKQLEAIERGLEHDSMMHRNAASTVWELITRKTLTVDDGDQSWRKHRRVVGLTEDQVLVIQLTGRCGGDGLHAPDCIGDGILRRFSMNSPLELALRLSIGARYYWAESQWSGHNYPDELFRPILQAIAARDFAVAEQLARLSPPVISKPHSRSYARIFTGVMGLLRNDRPLLEKAAADFKKSDPAYVKSIMSVLAAVAADSRTGFAEAMNKMLSAYRSYMYGDDVYGLFDPHALGLYELCRRYSPSIVEDFDVERKLPWDREYFAWWRQVDDISVHFDVEAVPEVMHKFLFQFEPIPWGQQVIANWIEK